MINCKRATLVLSIAAVMAAAPRAAWLDRDDEQGLSSAAAPQFNVDPFWPKPFPAIKGPDGRLHRWATGEIGGTCIDSHGHIFTLNRGWQNSSLGKLHQFEAMSSIPAPPVVVYDPQGNVVTSWGDASVLAPNGGTKVMPESLHGCFVDYDNNVWIGGSSDGIVQKYSHDGKLLLQIGTKGLCDGKAPAAPAATVFFPTCARYRAQDRDQAGVRESSGAFARGDEGAAVRRHDRARRSRGRVLIRAAR